VEAHGADANRAFGSADQRHHDGAGRLFIDREMAQLLYKASMAGVRVDLIARGACVRPGLPVSKNIRVRSLHA